jgi:hypothetical protein
MMGDGLDSSEVPPFVSDFLEGRLDDAGLAQLSELLTSDPKAVGSLVDAAIVHDMLGILYADKRSETAAVALLTSLGVPEESSSHRFFYQRAAQSGRRLFADTWHGATRLPRTAAALAATLLIGCGLFWMLSTRATQIATVTRILDAGFESEPLQVGARLAQGDRIRTQQGLVEITFDSGAVMAVKAPADVELLSPLSARSRAGRVTVDVGEHAHGFRIETPTASIVDWGTEFGVGVQADATDVIVFNGIVDLHAKQSNDSNRRSQRLQQGDALRVGSDGDLRRIVSMNSREYPMPNVEDVFAQNRSPVIASVTDNIRGNQTSKCYRIVHGGLCEDATAYVDRSHQWNGLDAKGLPEFLLGADYIMTFNDDKRARDLEVTVEFAQHATVFVFYDKRRVPPEWLVTAFEDTGIEIGLDEGPSWLQKKFKTEVGAGVSIDNRFGVWKSLATRGQKIVFGPQYGNVSRGDAHAMYGIAAIAR